MYRDEYPKKKETTMQNAISRLEGGAWYYEGTVEGILNSDELAFNPYAHYGTLEAFKKANFTD